MSSFIGTRPHQVPTNGDLGRLAFLDYIGVDDVGAYIPTIASATSIAVFTQIAFVSGVAAISNITPPVLFTNGGQITLIPTGKFTISTSGNIAISVSAEVSKPIYLTYEATTNKWYPSYSNTVNRVTVTAPASGSTLTVLDGKTLTAKKTLTLDGADSKTLTVNKNITLDGTDDKILTLNSSVTMNTTSSNAVSLDLVSGGTVTFTSNKLSVFSATTSAELAGVISDETGFSTTGLLVFNNSPTISTAIITDTTGTFSLVNTNATSVNIAGVATTVNVGINAGAATTLTFGSVSHNNTLAINGNATSGSATLTTNSGVVTANVFNSYATTGNLFGAATTINVASNTTAASTLIHGSTSYDNVLRINGSTAVTIETSSGVTTANVFNVVATIANLFGSATSVNFGNVATGAQSVNLFTASTGASTYNFATGAVAASTTKTINIGTGGAASSVTNVTIGSTIAGTTKVNYDLEVMQNITAHQNITAYYSSDKRLKENITPIQNPIEKLLKLSGNTFKWSAEYYATQNQQLVKEFDVGVVAQEVQDVLPEAVHERDNGLLAVDYTKLIPLLIECIKAQQVEINELKGR